MVLWRKSDVFYFLIRCLGFVIAFLPRSKRLVISWLQSQSTVILEPKKIKCVIVSLFSPFICYKVMGQDVLILVFTCWALSQLFHSPLSFIKRLFSSFLLSAIRVVSSAYLRLMIVLLAILLPACASFSSTFHMMYSAFTLNKQGDNIQPWCTAFPVLNQFIVPCLLLTVDSWPAYRFLSRHVR